jgi:hypothetical protein
MEFSGALRISRHSIASERKKFSSRRDHFPTCLAAQLGSGEPVEPLAALFSSDAAFAKTHNIHFGMSFK